MNWGVQRGGGASGEHRAFLISIILHFEWGQRKLLFRVVNKAPYRFGIRYFYRFTVKHGINRVLQIMGGGDSPLLAIACIKIVDCSAVANRSRAVDDNGFGRELGTG